VSDVVLVIGIALVIFSAIALVTARRRLADVEARLASSRAATTEQVEEVADQRDRFAQALDAVDDSVVVIDASGHVAYRNASADRFHDARHSEAVAEEMLDRMLERALAGETSERELPLFGPPREVLLLRALPLKLGERTVGAAGFIHDVTELKRIDSVRRDFVANVSHELKTPIGALGLLAETVGTADDPKVVESLSAQILREADRLARIVDDLLDLSLIEAQEGPTREQVPVRVLVEEAAERVRPLALARGIPLHDSLPSDDLVVSCDPAQVVSAITNLLDNAIKYSDPGARVELFARRVDGRAVIEVQDHGMGIPTKDLERIFERFYRVDKARSRTTGGTGLGLAIVRHVAQVHGGDVTVESVEGEGSTFRFALPLAAAASGIAEAS